MTLNFDRLAELNYQAQLSLLEDLRKLYESSAEKTLIQERLGLSAEQLDSVFSGMVEMNITDIRELAISLGVTIDYRVNTPRN